MCLDRLWCLGYLRWLQMVCLSTFIEKCKAKCPCETKSNSLYLRKMWSMVVHKDLYLCGYRNESDEGEW